MLRARTPSLMGVWGPAWLLPGCGMFVGLSFIVITPLTGLVTEFNDIMQRLTAEDELLRRT